jgi:hypothetical protein
VKRYQWDPKAVRFRDPDTGRYVSRASIRRGVDELVTKSQTRITALANKVRRGTITTTEWEMAMRTEIKRIHLSTEALLRGGWAQMKPADYGRIGGRLKKQYTRLSAFRTALEGKDYKTDGAFFARARSYASAARIAFGNALGTLLESAGYREERNKLNPAEHCVGCIDMTALGWVKIGTLVPLGQRDCSVGDQCEILYR